jgi:hypothetical protein
MKKILLILIFTVGALIADTTLEGKWEITANGRPALFYGIVGYQITVIFDRDGTARGEKAYLKNSSHTQHSYSLKDEVLKISIKSKTGNGYVRLKWSYDCKLVADNTYRLVDVKNRKNVLLMSRAK